MSCASVPTEPGDLDLSGVGADTLPLALVLSSGWQNAYGHPPARGCRKAASLRPVRAGPRVPGLASGRGTRSALRRARRARDDEGGLRHGLKQDHRREDVGGWVLHDVRQLGPAFVIRR